MALRELRREFPAEFRKAMTTFAIAMKGEAGRAIRTGTASKIGLSMDFDPLSQITKAIRRSRGNKASGFGGTLNKSVKSFASGEGQFIGWTNNLAPLGEQFQQIEVRKFTKKQRRGLYLRGIDPAVIRFSDGLYSRPAREVWSKIANHPGTSAYMLRVVVGRIKSIFERRANQVVKP